MAHGCPVICINSNVMAEIADFAAEYFNPDSIDDLGRAIENVVYDNQIKINLINLGFKRVKQFSWSKCAQETLNVYRSLS